MAALSINRAPNPLAMVLYHAGRIGGYVLLGAIFGFLGGVMAGADFIQNTQSWLSVIAGLVMIVFSAQVGGFLSERLLPLPKLMPSGGMLKNAADGKSLVSWLAVGVANGFLPCGLVYAALALSLSSSGLFAGAMIMLVFGLGTVPSLVGVAFIMRSIAPSTRGVLLKIMAVGLILFGLFLMFRATMGMEHEHVYKKETQWLTPWDITINNDGTSEVFGIVLGRTIVNSAMRTLKMEPEILIFRSPKGTSTLEAYFGKIRVAGFTGKLIANLEMEDVWLNEALAGAVKQKSSQSGAVKIILSSESYRSAMLMKIIAITYIPSINLDAEMVRGRFGEPAQTIVINETSEQWLYPDKGLSIAINMDGKEVFQYVRPSDFDKSVRSLFEKPKTP